VYILRQWNIVRFFFAAALFPPIIFLQKFLEASKNISVIYNFRVRIRHVLVAAAAVRS
jgi:hypothetical protein